MKNEDIPATEMQIKYTVSPQYRTYGATGAFGGFSPNGEVVFDFFIERQAPPETITLKIVDGKPNEEVDSKTKSLIRERVAGFVLRPDIALSIGQWLVKKAETALKAVNWGDIDSEEIH